jgi:hypothetical protein
MHSPSVVLAIVLATAVPAGAQQVQAASVAQARSSAIAASFSKFKNISKERHGIKKEKYLRVQSEPAVRANPADYSGRYDVPDMGFGLELRVNRDGSFDGTGHEPLGENVSRTFTLKNGRIQGALLTATKVYAGGETERFEGAFMNRSTYESPSDKGTTIFGFGTLGRPVTVSGMTINKFFYEKTS